MAKAKAKATKQTVAKPEVVEEVAEEIADVETDVVVDPDVKKEVIKRRKPTRDSICELYGKLQEQLVGEIDRRRESSGSSKGVRFLRNVNNQITTLRKHFERLVKPRKTEATARKQNQNSGFRKPVKLSSDMYKFTGWDASELRSRVDVTTYICDYIREHELQNSTDRREILADPKLSKLLKFDSKKEKDPLTYTRLQKFLKCHFIKEEPPAVTA